MNQLWLRNNVIYISLLHLSSQLSDGKSKPELHSSGFDKDIFYKNIEAEICEILKSILRTQD